MQKTSAFVAIFVALGFFNCQQTEPDQKPNIIYILADDLGYGDLGSYGQQQIKTPNLDRLADEGMRFTQHYAGSTVCAPSRACLMTGLHSGHSPIRGNKEVKPMGQHPLRDEDVTIAEMLKDAGYATGLIGKWGLGAPGSSGEPNNQGFDYFYGYLCQRHAHNYYPEFLFRNRERVVLEGNISQEPKRADGAGVAVERAQYTHDLFAQEALGFIEKNQGKPFFLMLTMTIPHANNEAGKAGMEVPDFGEYADKDWPDAQKGHAAMISRMDQSVGEIIEKLKTLGLDENTVIMFSSDNGPHREGGADPDFFDSNGPLRGIKRDLYEGGVRVPMIVRWPGRIKAGSESNHGSAFWDVLPTVSEIAGVEPPENIDGLSFLPELLGQEQPQHEYLYWEFHWWKASKQAVRMGDWKGVRLSPNGPLELYNVQNDPSETNNIAAENPEVVAQITGLIDQARIDDENWPLKFE